MRPQIAEIHTSGHKGVLVVTGGGSLAISDLLTVPGASRSILEARVPYAWSALREWLAAAPQHACSQHTARAMAMAAFWRAGHLAEQQPAEADHDASLSAAGDTARDAPGSSAWETLWGVACTASLATDRPKRGEHRFHVAWQTDQQTGAYSVFLRKGARSREEEERLVADWILVAVAAACQIAPRDLPPLAPDESYRTSIVTAEPAWRDVMLGRRKAVCVKGPGSGAEAELDDGASRNGRVLMPGAFHPLHEGHLAMAEWAERHLGRPVEFELSVVNVDKPPMDYVEIAERLVQFSERQTVWLTGAPTFVEKARLFPQSTFVVGADTIVRIADSRYYGSEPARDAALQELADRRCRFLVFGRRLEDRFVTLDELPLPAVLRSLCESVPGSEFRCDVSSTEIRAQQHVMED